MWLPLVNGKTRVGVVCATAPRVTAGVIRGCRALASVTGLLIASQAAHSDELARVTRNKPMHVAAEMLWAFLPPNTIGNGQVTSTALLEPAYQIAGDAFDHTLTDGVLHLTLVDSMGHDLTSGLSSAVALASCRANRRAGGTLADIVTNVDQELARWVPGRMLTGIFAHLDLATGVLEWVNCGHPPPLLIRPTPSSPARSKPHRYCPWASAPATHASTPQVAHDVGTLAVTVSGEIDFGLPMRLPPSAPQVHGGARRAATGSAPHASVRSPTALFARIVK